jgi:hypothetical protein
MGGGNRASENILKAFLIPRNGALLAVKQFQK